MDYVFSSAYQDPSDEKWRFFRDHLEQVCHKVIAVNSCFHGPRESRLWAQTVDELNVIFSTHPESEVAKELALRCNIFPFPANSTAENRTSSPSSSSGPAAAAAA